MGIGGRWSAVLVAATFGVVAVPTVVGADDGGGRSRRVEVQASAVGGSVGPGAFVCDPAQRCVATGSQHSDLSGDLVGTAEGVFSSWIDVSAASTVTLDVTWYHDFQGSVRGCGTGSYTSRSTARFTSGATARFRWVVVEGSGTGDLTRMRGEGTSVVTTLADGTTTAAMLGKLICRAAG